MARANRTTRVTAKSLRAASLALVLALAGAEGRAAAQAAEGEEFWDEFARNWTEKSLSVRFADDFLGLPKTSLRDDNGFVANLRVSADFVGADRGLLQWVLSEQLITERGGYRRVDEGRFYVTRQHVAGASELDGRVLGWTLGVGVVGNLGGSIMQDWAHRTIFEGRHLRGQGENQLQYVYPSSYDVLVLAGWQASIARPLFGPWFFRGGAEGVGGFGTGLFGELHPFVAIVLSTSFLEFEFREGAAIYGTNIRALTMPGGYVIGTLQTDPSARLTLRGPRWLPSIFSLDVDWNRGNTHQAVGAITVGGRY
jgi:hypothetical protein